MSTESTEKPSHGRELDSWYRAALGVSAVGALFVAVVFVLMVVNMVRARLADPADPARIEILKTELLKEPDNAKLLAELRELDVRLREDYFKSRRFAVEGLYLLVCGIAVCLAALHVVGSYRRGLPKPQAGPRSDPLVAAAMQRRSLAALGLLLGGLLITTAVMARHDSSSAYVKAAQMAARAQGMAGEEEMPSAATPLPTDTLEPPAPAESPSPSPAPTVLPSIQPGGGLGEPAEPDPGPQEPSDEPKEPADDADDSDSGTDEDQPAPAKNDEPDKPPEPAGAQGDGPTDTSYPTQAEIARNCPRFRSPVGAGTAPRPEPVSFPRDWDGKTGEGILWRTKIPLRGENSAIVWEGRVFCAGADETQREVYCFDADTGELLWQKPVSNELSAEDEPPEVSEETGYSAPTMATDGRRVFAIFANGDLGAFDLEGKQLWTRSMGRPENVYGHASSLITYPGLVIVQFDQGSAGDELSEIVALDAATGKRVWETPRPVPNSWASPIIIEHKGRKQVITCGDPWVISYDPATGKELWRVNCLTGDVGPSPIYANDLVIVAQDGADLTAIRPDGRGDVTDTHIAWQVFGSMPDTVSPVSDGQLVYVVTSWGLMTCFDAADGKQLWEQDLEASYNSSPTVVGDLIYLMDTDGVMHIMRCGSEFEEVGRAPLGEEVNATPAFVNGRIYVRGTQHMFCIGSDARVGRASSPTGTEE